MIPMIYGYARVSTDGQSVEAQAHQLMTVGCEKVFREIASGATMDRTQLCRLLNGLPLAAGDTTYDIAWSYNVAHIMTSRLGSGS